MVSFHVCCSLLGRERSEEHTSELQSQSNLVCRLLLEKKKTHTIHVSTKPQICTMLPTVLPLPIAQSHHQPTTLYYTPTCHDSASTTTYTITSAHLPVG